MSDRPSSFFAGYIQPLSDQIRSRDSQFPGRVYRVVDAPALGHLPQFMVQVYDRLGEPILQIGPFYDRCHATDALRQAGLNSRLKGSDYVWYNPIFWGF